MTDDNRYIVIFSKNEQGLNPVNRPYVKSKTVNCLYEAMKIFDAERRRFKFRQVIDLEDDEVLFDSRGGLLTNLIGVNNFKENEEISEE